LARNNVSSSPLDNKKLASYISKGILDSRLAGKKKYFRSKGLINPRSIVIEDSEELSNLLHNYDLSLLDSGSYNSRLYGKIQYQEYYANNTEELSEYVEGL
jgi:hypothetical protein